MDDIERGQEREQLDRELAIFNQRKRTNLLPVGSCYFCDSILRDGVLFCTDNGKSECRDDWDREQAAKKRNGGKAI